MATGHSLYSEMCSWLLDLGKVNYLVNLHFFYVYSFIGIHLFVDMLMK